MSAIKADCKPPHGALAPVTGWSTNRINISDWTYFNLPEQERVKVIGVSLLAQDGTFDNDSQLFTDPAYSRVIYIFLPDYMYACWYPGYAGEKHVQQIYYSALLDGTFKMVKPNQCDGNPASVVISNFRLTDDPKLKKLGNIYAANTKFFSGRNERIEKLGKQVAQETEQATEQAAKQETDQKLTELEKQAKAIMQKNQQASQKNISLKGIFIGMPIDEAKTLLRYHLELLKEDALENVSDRVFLQAKEGKLSSFEMDGGITMLFFESLTITGEELAQQLVDKYNITLEVDAYGKAWQYRDTKRGMKIQIGGDGSVRMEQIKSLIE